MVCSHSENIARLKLLESIWSVIAFLAQFRLPRTRLSVILQFCAFLLIISRNGNYKRNSVSPTAVPSNPPPPARTRLLRGDTSLLSEPLALHPAPSPVFPGSSFPLFDFPRALANFSCITEGGWSETAGIWGWNEFTISCICSHSNRGATYPIPRQWRYSYLDHSQQTFFVPCVIAVLFTLICGRSI